MPFGVCLLLMRIAWSWRLPGASDTVRDFREPTSLSIPDRKKVAIARWYGVVRHPCYGTKVCFQEETAVQVFDNSPGAGAKAAGNRGFAEKFGVPRFIAAFRSDPEKR